MRLITASHIKAWPENDGRDCQQTLPLLVRRLVRATARDVRRIDFPGGSAVSDEGWDGRLECARSHPMVPDGVSGWEIGTDKTPGTKAEGDYAKRTGDPLDLDRATTTFVAVTARSWSKAKHAWAKAKRAERLWADVRVVAAGELEQWLEDAPAVALWLARHLGMAPPRGGLRDLEGWWEEWAAGTDPTLPLAALLGGREVEDAAIAGWLAGAPRPLEVLADAPDEALGFLYAAAGSGAADAREALLSRCVVAETEEAARAAAAWSHPLVIAAPADVANTLAGIATKRGHHVFLAAGRTLATRGRHLLRLPRVDRRPLEAALVAASMDEDEAKRAAWDSGRSIPVLRRRLSFTEARRRPAWAAPDAAPALVAALLAGAWNEELPPHDAVFGAVSTRLRDREVLGALAGGDYAVVAASVRRHTAGDDPPLRNVGPVWRLTAPLDAWFLLAPAVETHHLDRLADAARVVLGTADPKYELPDADQWMAAVRGKERPHSGWLREGLAETLAIVAHFGDQLELPIRGSVRGFVEGIVREVLRRAAGWKGWASLRDVLPLLAEAAPAAFLEELEDLVATRPDEARALMADPGDMVLGECRHSGLLWAIERLAWHPAHLTRCCIALAGLDALDPGGKWGNRPHGSLQDFLMWPGAPYTFAVAAARLEALRAVSVRTPEAAWRLLRDFARGSRAARLVRDPPRFGEPRPEGWAPDTPEQIRKYVLGLLEILMAMAADGSAPRLAESLELLRSLPEPEQRAIVDHLRRTAARAREDDLEEVWAAARRTLRRLRSSPSDGRLADGVLEELERAERELAPVDPMERVRWLFAEAVPALPDGDCGDWHAYDALLRARRETEVRGLLAAVGPVEAVRWARDLQQQHAFGYTLAGLVDEDADAAVREELLATAADGDADPPGMLRGYAARRLRDQGAEWLNRWLGVASGALDNRAAACAALAMALTETAETWRRVAALGPEVDELYWRWTTGLPEDGASAEDCAYAVQRLCAVGRAEAALKIAAGPRWPPLPGQRVAGLLDALLRIPDRVAAQASGMLSHYVGEVFARLDRAQDLPPAEIVGLEWSFLPVLERTERGPMALHRALAAEPALFARVLGFVYQPDAGAARTDEGDEALTPEQVQRRGANAHRLLDGWRRPLPGQDPADRTRVEVGALLAWTREVRRLCAETGRADAGDEWIGHVLARGPEDPGDGTWPHRAVRTALEEFRGERVASGFCVDVYNSRGVTTRALNDGGSQERDLAAKYRVWARAAQASAPRTAALLERIAATYEADASREDEQAALRGLEYD